MNKGMQIFNNEEFGQVRIVEVNNKPYFVGIDVAKALGYSNASKAISTHCKNAKKQTIKAPSQNGNVIKTETNLIPEGDIYRLIVKSKLPKAEEFEKWVFDNILPTIRKTGGYVANDDMFVDVYLPFADEQTKLLFRSTLSTVRNQNEIINKQQIEIQHKSSVIEGLVEDVDLATKRQRINQIVRYKGTDLKIPQRWNLLYSEFEKLYHLNIKRRIEGCNIKPKIKSKVDYIDRVLEMIPELYSVACKVFETDIDKLKTEWEDTIKR